MLGCSAALLEYRMKNKDLKMNIIKGHFKSVKLFNEACSYRFYVFLTFLPLLLNM